MSTKRLARLLPATLLAVGVTMLLVTPATATHDGIHPTFRSERVYYQCGALKVNNANYLQTGNAAAWNTTAPAQSFQQGAGCGHLDLVFYGTDPDSPYDAVFEGTFTGNISSMTFEIHNLLLGQVRAAGSYSVGLRVLIDGSPLFGAAQGAEVSTTPELSSSGASEKMTFSLIKLGCAKNILDAQGNVINVKTDGFATEEGDGEEEHTILVAMDQYYLDQAAAFVWGATEVPSGITFNAATLAPTKVQPDDPATC
jgi:hypothetical protein